MENYVTSSNLDDAALTRATASVLSFRKETNQSLYYPNGLSHNLVLDNGSNIFKD